MRMLPSRSRADCGAIAKFAPPIRHYAFMTNSASEG